MRRWLRARGREVRRYGPGERERLSRPRLLRAVAARLQLCMRVRHDAVPWQVWRWRGVDWPRALRWRAAGTVLHRLWLRRGLCEVRLLHAGADRVQVLRLAHAEDHARGGPGHP